MKNATIACLLVGLAATVAFAEVPTLPFDQVERGMRGQGRTVFSGTEISTFEVEILGKLPDIGPDQNLILARCSGGPLEHTGVLAGMSGSPVTIDGKLVGAVAYAWGFSKDAIAGITPIAEMLRLTGLDGDATRGAAAVRPDLSQLGRITATVDFGAFFERQLESLVGGSGAPAPVALPLSVAGFGVGGLARVAPTLERAGMIPMQSGRGGAAGAPAPPLEPGSAVGLQLVRGDVELTATGTVTWVEQDGVLAFGHPLFGLGSVDLPLTAAEVQALLPSLNQSARIATSLEQVGALREDRATGVFGRLGAEPSLIPVRLQMTTARGDEHTYSFDVADDPQLAPLLLYVTLNGVLASKERASGNATVRLRPGSVIKMHDRDDVELDNLFAGPQASMYGTGLPAYVLYLLMNNSWDRPEIAGINLMLDYDDTTRTGRVRRIALDRYRARPGDTVAATIALSPYRGPDQFLTQSFRIPDETRPGTLEILIGGAVRINRSEEQEERVMPRDLGHLIRLINRLRRNDRVYIVATREDSGVLLQGQRLPNLPPSVNRVLSRPKSRGNVLGVSRRAVVEETIPTDFSIEGWASVQLEVEPR
ncbi:MAG: hypothetical protein GY716_13350 [bacterium]|nr:hypothetical protein [bacterium]